MNSTQTITIVLNGITQIIIKHETICNKLIYKGDILKQYHIEAALVTLGDLQEIMI